MEIREFAFSQTGLSSLREHSKGQNWPVVYLINNDKPSKSELYVGETTSAGGRFQQHLNNPERHNLDTIRFVFDDQFNKSAILDIEQTLIQMFMADQKFVLQNRNGGQSCKHDYYQRALYQAKVDEIWNELNRALLTNQDASTIRNSNLFKYSPFNTLTPEQEQVSQDILLNAIDCLESGETGTSVLSGKAGTGKSIVLIHMMYTLMSAMSVTYNDEDLTPDEQLELGARISLSNKIRDYVKRHGDLKIAFVVPMTSIRKTFKAVFSASKGTGLKPSMVIGPQEVLKKDYDIVFVDEAHRLARRKNLTAYGAFDKACARLGIDKMTATHLDMIQLKSRYSVLVYDECQTVKASDLTPCQFQRSLKLHGRDVHAVYLKTQMRCEGGSSYVEYLDSVFSVCQEKFHYVKNYDFRIWDNPNAMIEEIRAKEKIYSLCRVVAGYSWEWKSRECSTLDEAISKGLEDIELGGEKYVWNMDKQEWILRDGAVNEIGCVHTTQGYDLNYVAVIFGCEIDYDDESGSIVIDRSKFYDDKVKDGVDDETLKQYIINSYKVMMTRGIKGCYVYACNPGLQNYLKRFIAEA
jgi:DUF2075 family protein/predicted GIY-YIG superfamily endonuclease